MYRSFRNAQAAAASADVKESTDKTEKEEDKFDEDVRSAVNEVWKEVEKQCQDCEPSLRDDGTDINTTKTPDWNIVRVFVSSTFTDFYSEREILVKKVFPELREWCHERGLKLIECDLRWGVPRDTSTADTILVCLDEIERCRETNKGQPFVIGLIGQRYGWIPSSEDVADEAREKYGWVENSSITFMEMLVGAYRDKNPNAAFFMRDKKVCDSLPVSFYSKFVDEESMAKLHLKTLKNKIYERFPNQVFPYSCTFKQISLASGREQVELGDLDILAEKVTRFLKEAIERTYPDSKREIDEKEQEETLQWLFVLDKAKGLIGRQSEIAVLKNYLQNGNSSELETTEGANSTIRKAEDWDLHESDKKICVLEGESGWGKSALMCKLAADTVKSGEKTFFHIVNSTPASNRLERLLKRLLCALNPNPTEAEKNILENDDVDNLKKLLRTSLSSFREKMDSKLNIIIDGLNEIENSGTIGHLSWLPPTFPHNIHCIVSTNTHLPTTARLYEHPTLKMKLQPMTQADLAIVGARYLETFNKKLDSSQMNNLLAKTGVDSPLWMMLMVEELRIFGDFRLLDSKINNFPNTHEGFLTLIIDRLIQEDDENDVIRKVLCLIACSRNGLPSDKVLQICGNIKDKEELPLLYWARTHRQLKPYLRVFGGFEETITFSHNTMLKAVQNHLLSSALEIASWHTVWADYYQFWCSNKWAKAYHLPYHLERAMLPKRLLEFMQKDPDSYIHIGHWQRSTYLKNIRCRSLADPVLPSSLPLMLCHMCAMKIRGFNPACTWRTMQCCVICGSFCHSPEVIKAYVCMKHATKIGATMTKCILCNMMVSTDGKHGEFARLCMHCGFGHGKKMCARFTV